MSSKRQLCNELLTVKEVQFVKEDNRNLDRFFTADLDYCMSTR